MAATCQETVAVPCLRHSTSHSHRRTKRRFDPNIQKKTYYVPSLRRNVTLRLCPPRASRSLTLVASRQSSRTFSHVGRKSNG